MASKVHASMNTLASYLMSTWWPLQEGWRWKTGCRCHSCTQRHRPYPCKPSQRLTSNNQSTHSLGIGLAGSHPKAGTWHQPIQTWRPSDYPQVVSVRRRQCGDRVCKLAPACHQMRGQWGNVPQGLVQWMPGANGTQKMVENVRRWMRLWQRACDCWNVR